MSASDYPRAPMMRARAILTFAGYFFFMALAARAQPTLPEPVQPTIELTNSLAGGSWSLDPSTGDVDSTNGIVIYRDVVLAVLTADRITGNLKTRQFEADGHVRIQRGEETYVGPHIRYNFVTGEMDSDVFRGGQEPAFMSGHGMHGVIAGSTNQTYTATNAFMTADDVDNPAIRLRATRIIVVPNKRLTAENATLYFGDVPVCYFPYYTRNLGPDANNFNFTPGYQSGFGPFLLTGYRWYLNRELDGLLRMDYRERRGFAGGPDTYFHLGQWGEGSFQYYYADDHEPGTNALNGLNLPNHRQRLSFAYQVDPLTNVEVKAVARYQSDASVVHDFFEGEYRQDPQPDSYFDMEKFWRNFSLDAYTQPQVNGFLETQERLPEVRLTGYRQELGNLPVYYESESSAGYYRRRFADTNGLAILPDYAGARADTFHQLTIPETFFGWLNVTPRVGGRFTYYSQSTGLGGITDETTRGVFNTGAEVSFKASRLWPTVQSDFLEVDGLRHIIEPSVNYVYVPRPNAVGTNEVPQYDYQLPSLVLLPIDFPEYNSIDSIDSQNVIRWGLRNRLQTKRNGQVADLVDWQVWLDWRLQPESGQTTFGDLQSDLIFKPRSWLTLESLTRYNISDGTLNLSFTTVSVQPSDRWSWSISHYYVRDDFSTSPTALGEGNDLFANNIYYRLNENWGIHLGQHYEASTGRLQEQYYTIYRDLRSWTAAVSFRVLDNAYGSKDYAAVFTFSLKARPKYALNTDTVSPYGFMSQ